MRIAQIYVGFLVGMICPATYGQAETTAAAPQSSSVTPSEPTDAAQPAEQAAAPSPPFAPPAPAAPSSPKTSALFRAAQNLIDRYSPEARKQLNELDAKTLLAYAQGLRNSLQSSDWTEAQKFADQLGEKLNSGAIGACVRFLSIQAREGAAAARQAIESYLATADIPPAQRTFFEDLRTTITAMDAEDVIDTVTSITMIVCSHKFGHEGALIGGLVGEGLKEIFQVTRKPRDASGKPSVAQPYKETATP